MINAKYQLIFLGDESSFIGEIRAAFEKHLYELGLDLGKVEFVVEENFKSAYASNNPAFCLFFGDSIGSLKNLSELTHLKNDATIILPVVKNLQEFKKFVPEILWPVNGYQLAESNDVEPLVSCILEGLGLLRLSRRLFISYKRDESSSVAIQLFERFEKAGFDVFLDTHSIRPGETFQEELWHRLADTDIVVLLNTKGFLKSEWTTHELAQANSMSIGIMQLIWPNNIPERAAEISLPYKLVENDFGNNHFTDARSFLNDGSLDEIVNKAESLRARSLAARQDNIVTEFIKSADKFGIDITLQPEKFLTMKNTKGEELVIIPTVGVPQAFTYNQSEELVKRIKLKKTAAIYLLFDHRNIREKWLEHLAWLDTYLPIKTIKLIERQAWLEKI